ncbi:MAG TPA: VOC family protein [Actinophytocola sp.]|jgi:predicted enzyme related to lactoylglutathione lyase|uniref:VOC family protein n=1 Tax=Actinophytocola sp. TaxID=1872138 RepID=UPI002F95930D
MLRGFATINYYADDLAAARDWYAEFLGVDAYFEVSGGYVEFRVGDSADELGIVNRAYQPHPTGEPAGQIMYWAVDDVQATLDRLLAMGAMEHQPVTKRGGGFVTASVTDPFGNVLGFMYNQHYLDVLRETAASR